MAKLMIFMTSGIIAVCLFGSLAEECHDSKAADIVFLLDGSGSVGLVGFNQMLEFVTKFVDVFPIGPTKTQVGLVVFGSILTVRFQLNTYHDSISMKDGIRTTTFPNAITEITGDAIAYARINMLQTTNGMRTTSQKIAIVITDGRSADTAKTRSEAAKLRAAGVTMLAVGVGRADLEELKDVASKDSFVYSVGSFGQLFTLNGPLAGSACGEINKCDSSSCKNGATCTDKRFGYVCECRPGFTGRMCEKDIDECNSQPCINDATCFNGPNQYTCKCTSGWKGTQCHINIDECKLTNSRCDHGTCEDQINGYTCSCEPGYTDFHCETDIDECESNPCSHGTCTDLINDVSCLCNAGYTGKLCTQDIDECASSPCQNGGTCRDWVNEFSCECAPRFYGETCDTGICQPTVADLVFVLDSSISQSVEDFKKQLDFIVNFIDHVVISDVDFQVAVITYSFEAKIEFGLTDHPDNETLKAAIRKIEYRPGATFTDKGIKGAKEVFSKTNNTRRNGKTAKRFVFVVTDGMSTDREKTKTEALDLKTKVTKVAAIGIGEQVSHQELLDIASPGDDYSPTYVFSVNNFNALFSILKQLVHITCEECTNSSSSNVVFLLGNGVNMTTTDFQTGIDAITYIVDTLSRAEGNNSVQLGLVTYGEHVTELRGLDDGVEKKQWLPFLQTLVLPPKSCKINTENCQTNNNLHESLRQVRDTMLLNDTNMGKNSREIVIVVSNGQFEMSDLLQTELVRLSNEHINVFVIGVGEDMTDANISVLLSLVTDPNHMFVSQHAKSLTHLDALMAEFVFNSCELSNKH